MDNTLNELRKLMFEKVQMINNPDLSENEKKKIKDDGLVIATIAKQVINATNVATRAKRFSTEGKIDPNFVKEWIG